MDSLRDPERLERARVALAALLQGRVALPSAGALRRELEAESAPVLETLLGAVSEGNASEEHEAHALATLFGRRVATLAQSPTTALSSLDAIVEATALAGVAVPAPLATSMRAAAMEGFMAAVDERARTEMVERAGQSLVPVIASPKVVLLVVAGCDDAEAIAQALARLGRAALDADAKACLVHASFAREPERDVALEIAAFDASARMIGARAIFSGTPVALHALAAHAPALTLASTFEDALRLGLDAAEQRVRPSSLLARGLKRLRG